MRALFFILIFAWCASSQAQQLQVSPTSVQAWGQVPDMVNISIEHKDFELIGLFPAKKYPYWNHEYKGQYNSFNVGIFFKPLKIKPTDWITMKGGTGAFLQKFPTRQGSIIHFQFETTIRVTNRIALQYQHLSNGFGLQNRFNPGLDNIGILINL